MSDLQSFLKDEKKRGTKKFIGWITTLLMVSVVVIGGICWLIGMFSRT